MSYQIPKLYSFRRCPYAMRARMVIAYTGIKVELREILLRDKPSEMLEVSKKGTVPVLVLEDGKVIDESLEIMSWALNQNDPDDWLSDKQYSEEINELINYNDIDFKAALDKYKYFDRYPESPMKVHRGVAEVFIKKLEDLLNKKTYLIKDSITIADVAIFPFVRQFALVDKDWFYTAKYPKIQVWLDGFIDSDLFKSVMNKYKPYKEGDKPILFL